jgi:hypothetical protein
VSSKSRRLPNLALLTSTIEGARVDALGSDRPSETDRIVVLRLDDLWLDHQPREIVPEERLQQLIATGKAQPRALLEVLNDAASADAYYADVLDRLQGLSRSIKEEGVLQPIQVASRGGRDVVRDGHRRCLASLLAGSETIPAVRVAEAGEVEAVAHALIVNLQREDLTALEKGAAMLRLALLVARRLAADEGSAETQLTLDTLLGGGGEAALPDDVQDGTMGPRGGATTTIVGGTRALAAAVRDRVCAMVGIQPRSYYRLLALNRLTSEARALARGLTENQLRPIVSLAADDQLEVVGVALRRGLSAKEITTLAQLVRGGDRDAVRRLVARLAREDLSPRRTAVSWDSLLHAVPRDVFRRCQALRAELEALPASQKKVRLDVMWEQAHLLEALRLEFEAIFAAHAYVGPETALSDDLHPQY